MCPGPQQELHGPRVLRKLVKKSLVLIPTYNEAENIFPLLGLLVNEVPFADVLVVDDSSPDGTADRVRQFMRQSDKVSLIVRPEKDGLAQAYFAGFKWAIDHGYERVVQMDADFSHDPKTAALLLQGLDDADMVMGTRYGNGGGTAGWSKLRETISRSANLYTTTVLSFPFRDMTSGFNAWRISALQEVDYTTLKTRGYVYQVELKYRAHKRGLRLKEIPFIFTERRSGVSKISAKIIAESAWSVLKIVRN